MSLCFVRPWKIIWHHRQLEKPLQSLGNFNFHLLSLPNCPFFYFRCLLYRFLFWHCRSPSVSLRLLPFIRQLPLWFWFTTSFLLLSSRLGLKTNLYLNPLQMVNWFTQHFVRVHPPLVRSILCSLKFEVHFSPLLTNLQLSQHPLWLSCWSS